MEFVEVKTKSKKGTITPVMQEILIDALQLWQLNFLNELQEIKKKGKRSMFHENWSSLMLQEFGIKFDIEELINTQLFEDEA
jgi:hypothetical protein